MASKEERHELLEATTTARDGVLEARQGIEEISRSIDLLETKLEAIVGGLEAQIRADRAAIDSYRAEMLAYFERTNAKLDALKLSVPGDDDIEQTLGGGDR